MKKILVLTLALAILLAGCGGPSDAECENAWGQVDVDRGDETRVINMILNNEWAPDSIGFAVKECVESGWDGYR